jgi:hypothetical protein
MCVGQGFEENLLPLQELESYRLGLKKAGSNNPMNPVSYAFIEMC